MKFIAVAVAAGLLVSGCATKKSLSREVGTVNEKVENLSGEVEKTQERVRTATPLRVVRTSRRRNRAGPAGGS